VLKYWTILAIGTNEFMQVDNSEDEMVTSRILFLSTYDTDLDFEALIKKHGLGDNVNYVCPAVSLGYSELY
jgi:Guanine nucleotide exchange factor synembryn.